jgi:hypothetical protein
MERDVKGRYFKTEAAEKIFNKLKELLAGGKELSLSLDEIKKKAGAPNIANSTVSALIVREQERGNFKNLTVKKFAGGLEVGKSKIDETYKNNKKFRDFYNNNYETPWNKIVSGGNKKNAAYGSFLRFQKREKNLKGFTLTPEKMAEKLNISVSSLRTFEAKPNDSTSAKFISDNIKKTGTTGEVRYKDIGSNILKKWNALQSSKIISERMVNNIEEYDKVFRNQIKNTKKIPDITEVIQKTSMKTPRTIANTEALYSKLLRGETFKKDIDVAKDVVLGKRIINQLNINSGTNARRNAFYELALDNINKLYPQKSGTLGDFKVDFRSELKKILGLKQGQAVPFSVNEVIGLSTGESRGIQPFSVFVDAVDRGINEGDLQRYQGQFSKKVKKVQELLAGSKPNIGEAKKIASSLDINKKTLVRQLTEKGFTTAKINQLNLPDIKIGETIDSKIYSPATLKRYKEAGIDLSQFAKDKGFYVDVKKAKPFWESNIRNTIVAAAQNNTGNICNIFKGKIAFSKDGGRIGFSGGCGKEMVQAMQTDGVGTLNKINQTEGIIPKLKNAATTFLKFAGKGKTFAVTAGVGAGAGALVKAFRNDDPETYLTNDKQANAMILDTADQLEREERQAAVGDAPELLDEANIGAELGVTAAAIPGSKKVFDARKKKGFGAVRAGLGPVGKALSGFATPLGIAATTPLNVASQVYQGDSAEEILTDPLNYLGPAFAGSLTREATRGMSPTSNLSKALRLGMNPATIRTASRFLGLPGLALSLGYEGYDQYKKYTEGRGFVYNLLNKDE